MNVRDVPSDECLQELLPCSNTLSGNLSLVLTYAFILAYGAKMIAHGSETLMEVSINFQFYSIYLPMNTFLHFKKLVDLKPWYHWRFCITSTWCSTCWMQPSSLSLRLEEILNKFRTNLYAFKPSFSSFPRPSEWALLQEVMFYS